MNSDEGMLRAVKYEALVNKIERIALEEKVYAEYNHYDLLLKVYRDSLKEMKKVVDGDRDKEFLDNIRQARIEVDFMRDSGADNHA